MEWEPMTVDEAFKRGLQLVRDAGLPARGGDVAVLAAWNVFDRQCKGLEHDDRFPVQGPLQAKRLILIAYSRG